MSIKTTEYKYSPLSDCCGQVGIKIQDIKSGGFLIIPRDEVIFVIRDILTVYDDIY